MEESELKKLQGDWLDAKVLDALYLNSINTALGSFVILSLIFFVLRQDGGMDNLLLWYAFSIGLFLTRAFGHFYYKSQDREKLNHTAWIWSYRTQNLMSGVLVSALLFFFFEAASDPQRLFLLAMVTGLTAAAMGSYSVDMKSVYAFVVPAGVSTLYVSFFSSTQIFTMIGLAYSVYIPIILQAAVKNNQVLIANFRLNYLLDRRASRDTLVDLSNRVSFEEQFLKSMLDEELGVAIMFLDLDNFKAVNDLYGHDAGDEKLKSFAQLLSSCIRKNDVAARLGGDEFVIMLRLNDKQVAEHIGQKILQKLDEQINDDSNRDAKLGCSIGIGFSQSAKVAFESLMQLADKGCYISKNNGKNQVTLLLSK